MVILIVTTANSLHSSRTTVNDIVSHSRSPSIGSRHAISRFTPVHSATSTAQALSEHTDNASPPPSPPSPPPSPPFLSPSSQKAFSQVPTPWIASEYATFGVKVVDVIEKLVPQRVHLWLTLKYSPRDDKHGGSYMYHKLRLDDASQPIYQLLTSLNQQTCWYDYDPLASLATELGGDEGKKLVEDYEHKLQVYYSKTLATTTSPQIRRQFVAKSAPALTTVDYCAVSTVPTSTTPTFRHGKILVTPKKSKQKFESNYSCSLSPRRQALPVPIRKPLTPTNDRVSFRKLILTRASMECPANLRMTAIRHHQARTSLEITVTQGEHLIAVYQRSTEIFAQTQNGSRGFIPSDVTFLSSLYQTDPLKEIVYNTYEITSAGYKPLQAIAVKQHLARHTTELTVHKNTHVHILFHAKQWVYAVTEGRQAGFLHESHILYTSTH